MESKSPYASWRYVNVNEEESLIIPVALALDYDGCFGDTNAIMKRVAEVTADATHLRINEIEAARQEIEKQQKPFSTIFHIESALRSEGANKSWAKDIKPRLLHEYDGDEFLAEDATRVFDVARRHQMYEFVLTHGAVVEDSAFGRWAAYEWQSTKVGMTTELRDRPLLVSLIGSKGTVIADMYDPEVGLFRLPDQIWNQGIPTFARSVVLIDDKVSSFRNWPLHAPAYGIHTLPSDARRIRPAQVRGELPKSRVYQAKGLAQAAELLEMLAENYLYKDAA